MTKIYLTKTNGKITFRDKSQEVFLKFFGNILEGEHVTIDIEKTKQNDYEVTSMRNYYRGCLCKIFSDFTGYYNSLKKLANVKEQCPDDCNDILKLKFLYSESILDGKPHRIPKSLSNGDVTREVFFNFIDIVINWMRDDLDLRVPTSEDFKNNPNILYELYPDIKKSNLKKSDIMEILDIKGVDDKL